MSRELEWQIVERGRALIGEPQRWCRSAYAMDGKGRRVDWCWREAVAFCAIGALRRAAYDLTGDRSRAISISNRIAARMTSIGLEELAALKLQQTNDTKGHSVVLMLFDTLQTRSKL